MIGFKVGIATQILVCTELRVLLHTNVKITLIAVNLDEKHNKLG